MSASNLLLDAFIHDEISPSSDEQRLIGLIHRMRRFATDVRRADLSRLRTVFSRAARA